MKPFTYSLDDFEDDLKIMLYVVGALNEPVKSKLKLQKLLFFISRVFCKYNEMFDFEDLDLGPYSETVECVVEELVTMGLVSIVKKTTTTFSLTEKGAEFYNKLKLPAEEIEVVNDFKRFVTGLTDDEVLTFVYINYPKYAKNSQKWEKLKDNRLKTAISLLKKEKVSFGKACEISGYNSNEFTTILKERKVKWKA